MGERTLNVTKDEAKERKKVSSMLSGTALGRYGLGLRELEQGTEG